MGVTVPRGLDARSALSLSVPYGVAVALYFPHVGSAMPPGTPAPPLPLPLMGAVAGLGLAAIYGFFGWAGMRLARSRDREAAPWLTAFWQRRPRPPGASIALARAAGMGLAAGFALLLLVGWIHAELPESLPPMLHPASVPAAFFASVAGGIGEEILCRLLLVGLLLRFLPARPEAPKVAVAAAAILFALLHALLLPALYAGRGPVPLLAIFWVLSLNTLLGALFGVLYLRRGIGAAVACHVAVDLVWHVGSVLA